MPAEKGSRFHGLLIKQPMKEIDEMDRPGFLPLRAWDTRREREKKRLRQRFLDEVWLRGGSHQPESSGNRSVSWRFVIWRVNSWQGI